MWQKPGLKICLMLAAALLLIIALLIISWRLSIISKTPRLDLKLATYAQLKNWSTSDSSKAFAAFKRSCQQMMSAKTNAGIGTPAAHGSPDE